MSALGWPERNRTLELWAGPECTMNRLGDTYHDQFEMSGHNRRPDDIERFASLGIERMRYPVLWERLAPTDPSEIDWSFPDERLGLLRRHGVRPIVGLTHHGGAPVYSSLDDPSYPRLLAEFAARVAERYPWVDAWTPVNEPLTTARFSALYGLWHPHAKDRVTFLRCLLNQVLGTRLAMRAIREVNPSAKLVQTDDLGRMASTKKLRYQAEMENERRWLGWDLLCGRVTPDHMLWRYVTPPGIDVDELLELAENPMPPDVIGVNHYLSSERYVDESVDKYEERYRSGNGRDEFADTELVWMDYPPITGPTELLRQTWERYRLPVAVTESHLHGSREDQLRWLAEVWRGAQGLRAEGVKVVAVTMWSLLGTYDWDCLLTDLRGNYASGVFDVRSDPPRETALARAARAYSAGKRFEHPVLDSPGWWWRPARVRYHADERPHGFLLMPDPGPPPASRPVVITGGEGTLGAAFARECDRRSIAYRLLTQAQMDVGDERAVAMMLAADRPWAVVNAAGYARIDDAEIETDECMRANTACAGTLASACAAAGVRLAVFSSDLVFDGHTRHPYVEGAATSPLSVYGRSKALMEGLVHMLLPEALVVRTSALFGPWDEYNFLSAALRAFSAGERFAAAEDVVVSPTYVPDLVNVTLDLLIDEERGVWHVANAGQATWAEFARAGAAAAGVKPRTLVPLPHDQLDWRAPRPSYSALSSERGNITPPLVEALRRYAEEMSLV